MTQAEWMREFVKRTKNDPCKNCGAHGVGRTKQTSRRCNACHRWFSLFKAERPASRWGRTGTYKKGEPRPDRSPTRYARMREQPCRVCGDHGIGKVKNDDHRCAACYRWQQLHGEPRPKERWGNKTSSLTAKRSTQL